MITLCENCFNFYAKMVEKFNTATTTVDTNATNSYDLNIVTVICYSLICIVIISAISLVLYHLLKNWHENYSDKRKKRWEQNDREKKATSEYQSKILDFIEKEMTSCEKIYNEQKKQNDEIHKLITKTEELIKNLQDDQTQQNLSNLENAIKELKDAVNKLELTKLKDSMDGLLTKLKEQKGVFANSSYLITLNSFLKGSNNIDEVLKQVTDPCPNPDNH